mgnify:CR=1 FL=1
MSEEAIHARQSTFFHCHSLPEVDQALGDLVAGSIVTLSLQSNDVGGVRPPQTINVVLLHVALLVARYWVVVVCVWVGEGLVEHGAGRLEYVNKLLDLFEVHQASLFVLSWAIVTLLLVSDWQSMT